MHKLGRLLAVCPSILGALLIGNALSTGSASAANCGLKPCSTVPQGSCQPSSSLTVLVKGTNVIAYVPKSSWSENTTTGIGVVNVEGSSIVPTLVPTPKPVNSCASNAITGKTVCSANNTDIYLLTGTAIGLPLTSGATGTISFSGGSCTNCGVAMDAVHNKALISVSVGGVGGFQFLNLATSVFEPASKSLAPGGGEANISEDPLIDPSRNLLLSASEGAITRSSTSQLPRLPSSLKTQQNWEPPTPPARIVPPGSRWPPANFPVRPKYFSPI